MSRTELDAAVERVIDFLSECEGEMRYAMGYIEGLGSAPGPEGLRAGLRKAICPEMSEDTP